MNDKKKKVLVNPLDAYHNGDFPLQKQKVPGVQSEMNPKPDCGEESYVGHQRLEGRKVLVTGGDSGIGRAAAIAFAREGADVAINYLPSEQSDAEDVAQWVQKAGRKAILLPGDVQDENFCCQMVEEAHEKLEGLDILALVAGHQVATENIEDLTTEQLEETFRINVFSLFWIVKAALPHLPAGSSIITTTSIQAYMPSEILTDYAASKAAIVAFTRSLAKQLAPKGIRVNSIAPGPIWTPLEVTGAQPTDKLKDFGQFTPLKRAGQPAELAATYVLLASNESTYTTAEVYGITGGFHTT